MPIAAIPNYMGKDFSQASPGLRFGMYLPLWGINIRSKQWLWGTHDITYEVRGQQQLEREVKVENKASAYKQSCTLSSSDKATATAMLARQTAAFEGTASHGMRLLATAVAPFTTGLGNEHPLENGFAFLSPYGLPYLPGSGVKGVLRTAANELGSGQWGSKIWSDAKTMRHEVRDKQDKHLFDASDLDVLFGSEALDGENHLRGVLSFWDVIPQIEGNSLMVEIMTPHQGHYYQQQNVAGSSTPHDSGSPIPISFLTVPPKSKFAFHVVCDNARLEHLAPDLANNDRWKELLTEAFEHAFEWLGFGAKTSLGYGAMDSGAMQQKRLEETKKREQAKQALRKQKDADRQQQNAQAWAGAKVKFNRANKSLSVEKDGQTAVAIQPKGEELLNTLPADMIKKITGNQFAKVTAFVAEGVLVRVQLTP